MTFFWNLRQTTPRGHYEEALAEADYPFEFSSEFVSDSGMLPSFLFEMLRY